MEQRAPDHLSAAVSAPPITAALKRWFIDPEVECFSARLTTAFSMRWADKPRMTVQAHSPYERSSVKWRS